MWSRYLALFIAASPLTSIVVADVIAPGNQTANTGSLSTWWHNTGEINYQTPVQHGNVRQSHLYSAWVKSSADSSQTYYNSFVYETIPRNGQGNIITPGDPSSVTTADDGVTIEAAVWITMAWTQFLYTSDAWVKISRHGSANVTAANVVIRPNNLGVKVTDDGQNNIYVYVPYNSAGLRFSVEFQDNLYSYRDSCAGPVCDFVQNWVPNGPYYVSGFTDNNPVMGTEPHDALMIFASPPPSSSANLVPDVKSPQTYVVYPGDVPVSALASASNTNVYFMPGVHEMTATQHLKLSSSVNWVYLAPGAYVKGAIQFTTSASSIKATGFGVLSGEKYVYQANTAQGYKNVGSNGDSLRIWSGYSTPGQQQTFTLTGVTTNSPPFNSIDFTGDLNSISISQWDYKQVGAYFGQTDGTTLYSGSNIHDVFYHSGDDTIKTYGSDVTVRNIVVWKTKTAPIVQYGWQPRNLENILVDGVDVIHMHYSSNGSHPSIIGANQQYNVKETVTNTADTSQYLRNATFRNIRAQGIGGNLMRIVPLMNYENVLLENISLDQFSVRSNGIYQSELPSWTDGNGKAVSMSGFVINNFSVGGTRITQAANNYGPNAAGGLNIAPEYLANGRVVIK
ncbi:Isopullulanase complexed with Isopanose [Xylaria flabelliformis]|nr:Isopullulanase complexed with Isopanose [Xylaria flabelliformis]